MPDRRLPKMLCHMMLSAGVVLAATAAQGAVVISAKPTKNMSCSSGVCSPTAKKAVLNVSDLETMLESSDVEVTTGSGAVSIQVSRALSWASANRLTLAADADIEVSAPVTVAGSGGLTLLANNGGAGGDLLFAKKGHIAFWDLSSSLVIGGNAYTLAGDIQTLASDIVGNSSGFFALANTYDASADGTYSRAPILNLAGTLEGLGNVISNLTVDNPNNGADVGLLATLHGTVRDLGLVNATVTGGNGEIVGGLAGGNYGTIRHVFVSGAVTAGSGLQDIGGISGFNDGTIADSGSSASVTAGDEQIVGGLTGENFGAAASITDSFATGPVAGGDSTYVGGLVGGNNGGSIAQSYARGSVSGGKAIGVGGLAGFNEVNSTIAESYSTGAVSGSGLGLLIGGLIGRDNGTVSSSDWDLDTSGISDPGKGAGNKKNDSGITGLTTAQFQSGLPSGFDPKAWREKTRINGGYPYLLANPPAK